MKERLAEPKTVIINRGRSVGRIEGSSFTLDAIIGCNDQVSCVRGRIGDYLKEGA